MNEEGGTLRKGEWEGGLRDDEIEVLRASEVADAGVSNVGGFVSCHHVVPYTHLFSSLLHSHSLCAVTVTQIQKQKGTVLLTTT